MRRLRGVVVSVTCNNCRGKQTVPRWANPEEYVVCSACDGRGTKQETITVAQLRRLLDEAKP